MNTYSHEQILINKQPPRFSRRIPWLMASLLPLVSTATVAEESAEASPGSEPLETIVVEGQRPTELDLPGNLTSEGPFGGARSVLDTPRSLTVVDQTLLDTTAIVELRDLQRVVPNSYGANTFGASSLPTLRGQLGDIFQDGLRRQGGNNGLGLPTSFNAFEQIDVIKGPPPSALGASQRVGGFVNLIPKRPDLNRAYTEVELQGGTWDRYRQSLDWSQPIEAGRSAVRLSVEHRDENSYYDFARHDSLSLFGAYRLQPDADSVLDLNVEYYDVEFTDNAGFNRPTQELIDRGLYITGQGVQPGNGSTVPAPGSVVSPTGVTRLSRSRTFTDPDDINGADTLVANLRYAVQLGDGLSWTTRAIYQHLEREEIAQNSFVEIIDGADTFNLRTELAQDFGFDAGGLSVTNTTTFGVEYRYHDVLGFSQFTTEADNPVDLSGPIENRRIPLTAEQQARLVQLRPGLFVSPGAQYDLDADGNGDFNLSDTTDSTAHQAGLFVQHAIRPTERWELLLGLRGDYFDVTARDGAPPPGVARARDTHDAWLGGANAALLYKPVQSLTTYVAASRSESTSNSLGGGFVLGGGNQIARENFETESDLLEVGVKWSAPDGRWYADLIWFDQTRSLRNRDGSNSGIQTQGVESQLAWRPTAGWFVQVAGSYLDVRFDDAAAFQDSRTVLDTFDASRPDIVVGTGAGSPNFTAFAPSDSRVPGLPRVQASALTSYESPMGWGGSLNAQYTESFPLDFLQTVQIRDQVTVNAGLFWKVRPIRTDFRIDVFNLTDEDNWSPVFEGGFFGSTLVFPEPPVNVMVSVRHHFSL